MIQRVRDRDDGRAVRVQLTANWERLAERALQAVIAADEEFLAPLNERQRDTVAATLKFLLLAHEEGSPDAEEI